MHRHHASRLGVTPDHMGRQAAQNGEQDGQEAEAGQADARRNVGHAGQLHHRHQHAQQEHRHHAPGPQQAQQAHGLMEPARFALATRAQHPQQHGQLQQGEHETGQAGHHGDDLVALPPGDGDSVEQGGLLHHALDGHGCDGIGVGDAEDDQRGDGQRQPIGQGQPAVAPQGGAAAGATGGFAVFELMPAIDTGTVFALDQRLAAVRDHQSTSSTCLSARPRTAACRCPRNPA